MLKHIRNLKYGDERPQEGVEVLAIAFGLAAAVFFLPAKFTAEQMHAEDAVCAEISVTKIVT